MNLEQFEKTLKELVEKSIKYDELESQIKLLTGKGLGEVVEIIKLHGLPREVGNIEYNHKIKIPQFVAGWVEFVKNARWNILELLSPGISMYEFSESVEEWLEEDIDEKSIILIKAWDYGYEVEEEQKYYIPVPYSGGYYWKTGNLLSPIGTATGGNSRTLKNCEFTQQEINELLPEVDRFKKPVEST